MVDLEVFKILEGIALQRVRASLPVKMTKYRLGKLLQVEAKRMSVWENGQVDMRLFTLYQLAEAMGVPATSILEELDKLIKEYLETGNIPPALEDLE